MTDEQIEAIRSGGYKDSPLFTGGEKALIDWAHHLTRYTFKRHPEALGNMKKHFDHAQIVEATLVSGYFNMWNRFTDALEVDVEGQDQMALFTKSVTIDPADLTAFLNQCWWARENGVGGRGRAAAGPSIGGEFP